MSRRDDLAQGLDLVRERISRACAAAGRDPREVTLVAVTKTWPASDVALLADLGVTDVGESRDQEARPKHAEAFALGAVGLRWHFIGQLQRNKARAVVGYADVVESLDRPGLADALASAARAQDRRLDVLLQVSLEPDDSDGSPGRAGVRPQEAMALAEHVLAHPSLRIAGVMGVAPLDGDPQAAFMRLRDVHARIRSLVPEAEVMSAGMSDDLEQAIACGATHVRVGSALLGSRTSLH